MRYDKYIEINPKVMVGKPVIKSTRIPVGLILNLLANSYTVEKVIKAYPVLNKKQIEAALSFAAEKVNREENYTYAVLKAKEEGRIIITFDQDFAEL